MQQDRDSASFATIDDVAELAKVSRITVSRVFSSKWAGRIRPETVERVLQAATKLRYTPNNLARGLSSQRSNIVAVVVNARPGFFYSEVLNRMVEAIQLAGWQALVFTVDLTDDLGRIISQVLQHRVDAVVVTSAVLSRSILKFFGQNPPIPVVLFKRVPQTPAFGGIWCDEQDGARQAAQYLLETGHRHIAVFSHSQGDTGRSEAFIGQLQQAGLLPTAVFEGEYSHASGYALACRLMEEADGVDALFCDEDSMAMGAMDALRQRYGLRIPSDISIVGFDDSPVAELPAYGLTSVGHPLDEMIAATIDAIRAQGEDFANVVRREFAMKLAVRTTVATR